MPRRQPVLGAKTRSRTVEWDHISRVIRERAPLCVICLAGGTPVPAVCVDHKIRLSAGGSNDADNLQPLCAACHTRKTRIENAETRHRFRRAVSVELIPPMASATTAVSSVVVSAGLITFDDSRAMLDYQSLGYWPARQIVTATRDALYACVFGGAIDADLRVLTWDILWTRTLPPAVKIHRQIGGIDEALLLAPLLAVCCTPLTRQAWLSDWRSDVTKHYATIDI